MITEVAKVLGGTLYLRGSVVWVIWDQWGQETWSLEKSDWGRDQARRNFHHMQELWGEMDAEEAK